MGLMRGVARKRGYKYECLWTQRPVSEKNGASDGSRGGCAPVSGVAVSAVYFARVFGASAGAESGAAQAQVHSRPCQRARAQGVAPPGQLAHSHRRTRWSVIFA